jgi:hypothetical protein
VVVRTVAERPWGFWTESKLDMLSAYLPAFTTASKRSPSTVYLDLFAGQVTNVSRDTGRQIEGGCCSLCRSRRRSPWCAASSCGKTGRKAHSALDRRHGVPLYDMIFATNHKADDKIMKSGIRHELSWRTVRRLAPEDACWVAVDLGEQLVNVG